MASSVVPGLYGKLPTLGDFVTRRLPASFIRNWDLWIQEALSASKEQLDSDWLDVYLTSPIWRFILSPGTCGEKASVGILMPSVDKVGRYFPLTIAAMLEDWSSLPNMFLLAADWFDNMEKLALSALEDDVKIDQFDRKLQKKRLQLPITESIKHEDEASPRISDGESGTPIRIEMAGLEHMAEVFIDLGANLLTRLYPEYSLWSSNGSELMMPSLMVYKGLPPADAFTDFLTGNWQSGGHDFKKEVSSVADFSGSHEAGGILPPPVFKDGASIKWRSRGCSTAGKVRDLNEDAYLEKPENGLWVVADGMGGHLAGDEASMAIVDALSSVSGRDTIEALTADVMNCLQKTNADLIRLSEEKKQGYIVGSTVVVMLAVGDQCASIWAGDSRLYRYRDGCLSQLTRDHALEPEMVTHETSSSESSDDFTHNNVITKALGAVLEFDADYIAFEATHGDVYLLCSDGLIKEVNAQEISEILSQSDYGKSSQDLINLALSRGARDNVTAVVVSARNEVDVD